MKKELKDYLKFYIGCLVIGEWDDEPRKGYLTGIHGEHEAEIQFYEEDGINVFENPEYNQYIKVKPLLRPLSSMIEQEAIEIAKLSEWEPHFNDVKVHRNKFNDIIVTWQGMAESRESFNATGECFYCSEQFQWLLSKNFDLFDLIESDLALPLQPNPINIK